METIPQILEGNSVHGVDVSNWQGNINWSLVKGAGVAFAFLKATEGAGFVDGAYGRNLSGCRKESILVGAYHFARPGSGSAAAQAKHFTQVVVKYGKQGIMPALDLEDAGHLGSTQLLQWVEEWLATVKQVLQQNAVLYVSPAFVQAHMPSATFSMPLWTAQWQCKAPRQVPGWKSWTFWQYTNAGRVAGIEGNVDLDVFRGTAPALQRLWPAQDDTASASAPPTAAPSAVVPSAAGGAAQPTSPVSARPLPQQRPELRQGSSGTMVRVLQLLLYRVGQRPGALDGHFGPQTRQAVAAFQRQAHLSTDGIVGTRTWAALATSATSSRQVLALGQKGAQVEDMQNLLNYWGAAGTPLQVDGTFGPRTESAVRGFQTKAGCAVDGIVGPETWAKLVQSR